jgi:hypothetical protein
MNIKFLLLLFLFLPFRLYSNESLNVGDSFDQYVKFMKKLNIEVRSLKERSMLLYAPKGSAVFIGANLGAQKDENVLKTYGLLSVSFNAPLNDFREGEIRYITSIDFRVYPKNKNIMSAIKQFKSFPLNYENEVLNQSNVYIVKYYQVSIDAFYLYQKINSKEIKKGKYSMDDIVKISKEIFKNEIKFEISAKMTMNKKVNLEDDCSLFELLYGICLSENVYLYLSDNEKIIIHDSKDKDIKDRAALETTLEINAIKEDFFLINRKG